MSLSIRKERQVRVRGIASSPVPAPVSEWDRIQKNSNGTLTVIVNFFENQAALDSGAEPFDTISYQVAEPAGLEAIIQTALKSLPDFDVATTKSEDAVIIADAAAAIAARGQGQGQGA